MRTRSFTVQIFLDDEVDQGAEDERYEGYDRGEGGPHLQVGFRIYLEEAAY